jgi:acylphosphatase
MSEELRAIFRGKVQGVGFRATAKHHADLLKLVGFAKNLADGTVEVCIQGEAENQKLFIEMLKREFSNTEVDIHYHDTSQKFKDFKVY